MLTFEILYIKLMKHIHEIWSFSKYMKQIECNETKLTGERWSRNLFW